MFLRTFVHKKVRDGDNVRSHSRGEAECEDALVKRGFDLKVVNTAPLDVLSAS